jgi:hypothetical protein
LLRGFWQLSFEAKLRSVVGTMRRAIRKGWWKRRTLVDL